MTGTLLIATTNPGKVREVRGVLQDLPGWKVISLEDLPPLDPVAETGATFRENAVLKAAGYGRHHQGLTLADDSGLCVDALDGAPGVQSARFGGPDLDDAGRLRHLLERLKEVPEDRRAARFVCALALARGDELLEVFEGKVEGVILREPRGGGGFGYDPVFYHPPSGRAFAELAREEKAAVSHRGRALAQLREWMAAHLDGGPRSDP